MSLICGWLIRARWLDVENYFDREGINVVRKSYTTTVGIVIVENGKVSHPDGTVTNEH